MCARRLRHVGIVVSNINEALNVYENYLGCDLVTKSKILSGEYLDKLLMLKNVSIKTAILRTQDDNRIELIEYISHKGEKRKHILSNNIGASHFAITVEDIEQLYNKRNEYNVKFLNKPLLSPDGYTKVCYAILMDECIVELVEVLDERARYSGGNIENKTQ